MSLEKKVQRWIAEQRQIFIDKNAKETGKDTAKRAVFVRMNEDGTSTVLIDGVEKKVKLTGDTYLKKGESVLVDEIKTGEAKRKRRRKGQKQVKKISVKKKVGKREIISEEEEETAGLFFAYTSFVNNEYGLANHVLRLYEMWDSFEPETIANTVNIDLYEARGLNPYLTAYGITIGPQTVDHDGSFLSGGDIIGTYSNYGYKYRVQTEIFRYDLDSFLAIRDSFISEIPSYYQYLDSDLKSILNLIRSDEAFREIPVEFEQGSIEATIIDYHGYLNYFSESKDLFIEAGLEDPLSNNQNVLLCTRLDTLWDIDWWPQAQVVTEETTETITAVTCGQAAPPKTVTRRGWYGNERIFEDAYYTSPTVTTYDWRVSCRDSDSDFKGCSPSNPSSYPCGPCNCGTGFFGCDYYTIVYYDCAGNVACEPHEVCFYAGTGNSTTVDEGTTRYLLPIRNWLLVANAESTGLGDGTYPVQNFSPGSISGQDYYGSTIDYPGKKIMTVRDSLIGSLLRAKRANYYLLLDFGWLHFVSTTYGTNDYTVSGTVPFMSNNKGALTHRQTAVSIIDALDSDCFVYTSPGYKSFVQTNVIAGRQPDYLNAAQQEQSFLTASTNKVFEQMFSIYGPVNSAEFATVKVFVCMISSDGEFQVDSTGSFGLLSASAYLQKPTPTYSTGSTSAIGPLRMTSESRTDISSPTKQIKKYIREARNWFYSTAPAVALAEKPVQQVDKYNYVLFAYMCGLFGKDQLLSKDPDGDEKYEYI